MQREHFFSLLIAQCWLNACICTTHNGKKNNDDDDDDVKFTPPLHADARVSPCRVLCLACAAAAALCWPTRDGVFRQTSFAGRCHPEADERAILEV